MKRSAISTACSVLCLTLATVTICWSRPSAEPARPAQTAGVLVPSEPAPLAVTHIAVEPRWDHAEAGQGGSSVTLATEFRLGEAPGDWVQVSVGVPSGWKAAGQQGDWTSFYFRTPTKAIAFEVALQQLGSDGAVVQLPVLIQTGGRQTWLEIYLQRVDHGFCVAIARADEQGHPLWFGGQLQDGSDRGYWSFLSTVSEALQFAEQVLDISIYPPSYLSCWCGVGTRAVSARQLVEVLSSRAGCVVESVRGGEHLVDFAPGYAGGADASWYVLARDGRFTIAAEGGVGADVLVPALVEAAGATLAPSPDLASALVSCSWTGSFRGALEAVCAAARPPLIWEERAGAYAFRARDGGSDGGVVPSP